MIVLAITKESIRQLKLQKSEIMCYEHSLNSQLSGYICIVREYMFKQHITFHVFFSENQCSFAILNDFINV